MCRVEWLGCAGPMQGLELCKDQLGLVEATEWSGVLCEILGASPDYCCRVVVQVLVVWCALVVWERVCCWQCALFLQQPQM
jgi:hypothetical protein